MNKLTLTFMLFLLTSVIANAADPVTCNGFVGNDLYVVNLELQNPTKNSIIEITKNDSLLLRIQGEGSCGVMLVENQRVQDTPHSRPYKQTTIDALQNENCNNTDISNMNIVNMVLNQRGSNKDATIGIQLKGKKQPDYFKAICK